MGCDGGTIPKRDELVRTKKKKEQKDKNSELNFRWRCCSISQEPLEKPIVACGLGKLYSKASVITGLLDRSVLPDSAKHLKSLKDVKELQLTSNPAFNTKGDHKGDGYVDHQTAPYICPIIGLEMNGKFKFVFLWSCGCVVSERALKELKSETCHKCQTIIKQEDIVIVNPSGEDLELMETRLAARQAKMKAEKKAKKAAAAEGSTSESKIATEGSSTINGNNEKPNIAFVKAESKGKAPQSSTYIADRSISNGLKRGESLGMQAPDLKKAKSDYSVAKDESASHVYKSIFTSSSKAQKQDRAHWITYNPFYN